MTRPRQGWIPPHDPDTGQCSMSFKPEPSSVRQAATVLGETFLAARGGRRTRAKSYPTDEAWFAFTKPFFRRLTADAKLTGGEIDPSVLDEWTNRIRWAMTLPAFWSDRFGNPDGLIKNWNTQPELRSKWEAHLDAEHAAALAVTEPQSRPEAEVPAAVLRVLAKRNQLGDQPPPDDDQVIDVDVAS